MKTYLAKLVFNVSVDNLPNASEFDEQIRIVEAATLESAFHKARSIGRQEEETFVNLSNRLISWQFIDVAEVYSLESVKDGEQVYSSTHTMSDPGSYIQYVRRKSMEIQAKNLTFA
jgi:hypothetical protein